jgi:hypothetical protein
MQEQNDRYVSWSWRSDVYFFVIFQFELPTVVGQGLILGRPFSLCINQGPYTWKCWVSSVCSLLASDVKYILADHSRWKIWTVTNMTFALWYDAFRNVMFWLLSLRGSVFTIFIEMMCHRDARTRELLKVFRIDGQVESGQLETPLMPEQTHGISRGPS